MPSYRVTLSVGTLAPGVEPASIVPTAAALAAERTVVEAQDVRLVRGVPQVVVRYEAEDDRAAITVAEHVTSGMRRVAVVPEDRVTRRDGGRWVRVA